MTRGLNVHQLKAHRLKNHANDNTSRNATSLERAPIHQSLWFVIVGPLRFPHQPKLNRLYVHSATSHGLTSNDTNKLIGGLPQNTIFDSLDENGFNFGIYYQQPPSTLFYRSLRKLKYIDKFHEYGLTFKKYCEEGKLLNYLVIEQKNFNLGSPQWNEMLFVITYDQHGGFYDHVPTPVDGVPTPDDIVGPEPFKFKFDRLVLGFQPSFISP
ncbi:phosphoesterase family protein [Medicago truncatula]|uniref:Phosphoesterase family protein n=1 Tax=Medicago truncatula TaxID=3880 RepID=G7L7I6_MEDTR|nr:phosphoesterase family protein [Medicago truncatula]